MTNLQKWFTAWIISLFAIIFSENFFIEAISVFIACVLVAKLSGKSKRRSIY